MRMGGRAILAILAVSLFAGLADFDSLFAAFHVVFFREGTWIFPAESLLIRLFPLRFWVVAGAAWGAFTVVAALVLIVVGRAGASVARSARAE
jgi:uncharacterized membrane protein